MSTESNRPAPTPLILTKLTPPRFRGSPVARPRLFEMLDVGAEHPVTLISAPAGYGKTTLVASWLEQEDRHHAWASLDEEDGDLHRFLRCFLAALETAEPAICPNSRALLALPDLPPVQALVPLLANELELLSRNVLLVLDDLHRARGLAVADLLRRLLERPPSRLRLVLVSRADPPLPWPSLRAAGQSVEIRGRDLRFTAGEASEFFRQAVAEELDVDLVSRVAAETEGWAVGLRLAAVGLRHRGGGRSRPRGLQDAVNVRSYLAAEVLTRLEAGRRRALLATAVLERFSPALCDAVLAGEVGKDFSGHGHIAWLVEENLFVVSLDEEGRWYRFHHLFRDLLLRELESREGRARIDTLRCRAAAWLESRGFFEEALAQLEAAGRDGLAAGLLRRHRTEMMNGEQWSRLDRWMLRLSPETIETDPELLILRAWICENRLRYPEMFRLIDEAAGLVEGGAAMGPELRAELDALLSMKHFVSGEAVEAEALSRRALEGLPSAARVPRGMALILRILSFQLLGELGQARSIATEALTEQEPHGTTLHTRVLAALCFAEVREGETRSLIRFARELLSLGERFGLPESASLARSLLGAAYWDRDELEQAEQMLRPLAGERVSPSPASHAFGVYVLALIETARARQDEASELMEGLARRALELQNPELIPLVQAFEADLDRRHGRLVRAARWAREVDLSAKTPQWRGFPPLLTRCRILLGSADPAELDRGKTALGELEQASRKQHDRRTLVDALLLGAHLDLREGNRALAAERLQEAVDLARPRGLVRPFLDAGAEVVALLHDLGLELGNGRLAEVGRPGPGSSPGASSAIPPVATGPRNGDPLANRELDVLELLAARLTNKEIAARLAISSGTVKRHTVNIYQKLQVHGRREAVARARATGVFAGT